jgi:hypothetical protein
VALKGSQAGSRTSSNMIGSSIISESASSPVAVYCFVELMKLWNVGNHKKDTD